MATPSNDAIKPPDGHHLDPAAEHAANLFREVWAALEREFGRSDLRFPREIIWLNGAPGSGKGTNTPFILRERSISAKPVVVSDLLSSPEFKRLKDGGNLIGDRDVTALLLRRLLDPIYRDGVIVDGYPRTKVQVECLKLLYQRMLELRKEFSPTPLAEHFPKPVFRITVLYVEERESVERQLRRGRQVIAHNQRVRETGEGELLEERATDISEDACRKRYRIFKEQALDALQGLKKLFHYHLINAQGDVATVERNIIHEFQYQSSLELEETTLDAISHIPVAYDLTLNARQHLVRRLDAYQREHAKLFKEVIAFIEVELLPVIQAHAITGLAYLMTENPLFAQPIAMTMVIDILNERGYFTVAQIEWRDVPVRNDPATNHIVCTRKAWYRFQVRFQGSVIRRGH